MALPFLGILVLLLLSLPEVSFCQLLRKSHVLRKSHASTHEPTDTRATLGLSARVALLKNQSSQATFLELWAFPDLQGPPETQLDTSWSHLETPQKHRKRPNLTGKCLKQEVVLGFFQSSQGTVLEPGLPLNSRDLLGHSSTPPGAT